MTISDFLLGEDGDIKLSLSMDAIPTHSLSQRINIALRWFLGEWKFDGASGVDWFNTIYVKNPDEEEIEAMVTGILMNFSEIINVTVVKILIDKQKRAAVISWKAQTSQEIIESEVEL